MRNYYWLAGVAVLAAVPLLAQAGTPQLSVSKPWIRYLLPNIPAGGYMQLINNGNTDAVLTGAASPACGMLMLHQSQDNGGMAMMMDVPSVTVPAHGSLAFVPGGYHLMCMQPKMQVGSKVDVTLSFQDGSTLAVAMPIYGASGVP